MLIPFGPPPTDATSNGVNIARKEKRTPGTAKILRGKLSLSGRSGGNTSANTNVERGARLATAKVNLTKKTDWGMA
jgi:hypothetical protein